MAPERLDLALIVLDTNLLYAFIGLEKPSASLAASLKAVESRHKLAVTTVTVIEAVSKFRQDLSTLRKALLPVRSGRLSLISIGYLPVSNDELESPWKKSILFFRITSCSEAHAGWSGLFESGVSWIAE
jgi:hypothetical protein